MNDIVILYGCWLSYSDIDNDSFFSQYINIDTDKEII